MERYRALIVGAGRMGAGYGGFDEFPYTYNHARLYARSEETELLAFVEPDNERALWAEKRWGVPAIPTLEIALSKLRPDIVSVCTQPEPESRIRIIKTLEDNPFVKGIFCEKPWAIRAVPKKPCQVDYIRRFDSQHVTISKRYWTVDDALVVLAKMDLHTVPHFTDLARFWKLKKDQLQYCAYNGPCSYFFRHREKDTLFSMGGIEGGFMEKALHNLIAAIEEREGLISPVESAIESEKWADEILRKDYAE